MPVSAASLLTALGGARNVRDVRLAASRLCITLADGAAVSAAAIDGLVDGLSLRGAVRPQPDEMHLIVGPAAPAVYEQLNRLRITTA
jgi:PTS system beta-glucosides-specific IIC component